MRKSKKFNRNLLVLLFVVVYTFAMAPSAMAQPVLSELYGFENCSNRNPANVATGEAQLTVIVTLLPNGNIEFRFENNGPNPSSLMDIHFHDPLDDLVNMVAIRDSGAGVDFSEGAHPPTLFDGNLCPDLPEADGFGVTTDSADSNVPDPIGAGINPGEWLEIEFQLSGGFGWRDIISGLSSGQIRIGLRVHFTDTGSNETFVNVPDPTYVQLNSFAVTSADEGIVVQWETATEIDNAGFNLYRSSALAGPYEKINSQLIAAVGAAAQYEYVDAGGDADAYYRLEDVDYNGTATLHLPVQSESAAVLLDNFIFIPLVQGQ